MLRERLLGEETKLRPQRQRISNSRMLLGKLKKLD